MKFSTVGPSTILIFTFFPSDNFRKFPRKISDDMGLGPVTKSDIVKTNQNFYNRSAENTLEIIHRIHMFNI